MVGWRNRRRWRQKFNSCIFFHIKENKRKWEKTADVPVPQWLPSLNWHNNSLNRFVARRSFFSLALVVCSPAFLIRFRLQCLVLLRVVRHFIKCRAQIFFLSLSPRKSRCDGKSTKWASEKKNVRQESEWYTMYFKWMSRISSGATAVATTTTLHTHSHLHSHKMSLCIHWSDGDFLFLILQPDNLHFIYPCLRFAFVFANKLEYINTF